MEDTTKAYTCKNCEHWCWLAEKGYCENLDRQRFSWDNVCKDLRAAYSRPEPEPEESDGQDTTVAKHLQDKHVVERCRQCEHLWIDLGDVWCSVFYLDRVFEGCTCSLFEPLHPKPEPEPEPDTAGLYTQRKILVESVIYTIGRYLKGNINHFYLVDTLTAFDVDDALAQRITDDLRTLKANAAKYASATPPPLCSHWAEHLKTLRYAYIHGEIDSDVVLAALDPGQTDNTIVDDLLNAWKWQRMYSDPNDAPPEVFGSGKNLSHW